MIISVNELKQILNKITNTEDLMLTYSEIDGFKFKNSKNNLEVFEKELNSISEQEEFITIRDIEQHIKMSKPTIVKLLKENNISILDLNTFKIKKSDYLMLLLKYYK